MNPDEFEGGPGRIEMYGDVPCYQPASLPPEISYTDDMLRAYGDARYALGQLSTLHDDIENENLLIAPFVVREAAMSSQIEGTDVTVSDIVLHNLDDDPKRSAAKLRDVREAYNYVEAIRTGFDALAEGRQIDEELICDLHETLLIDVRGEDKRPGQMREDIAVMIGPDNHIEHARFVPASPQSVRLLVDQLLAYIRSGTYPPLIDIALTHYQFETIHPFRDGNGRLGRLLIMLQLYQSQLLSEPYLYLSAYFNRYRTEYFDRLLAVSQRGDWETWIVFVLNAIAEQAIDAYDCGRKLVSLRNGYREKFPNSPAVRDVIDHLFEEPYLKASRAIEGTGRSRQAVYDAIEKLTAEGIIQELTDKQRNRVFEAPEILALVESP
ncbi:Fic family protein [Haloarchaeobius sp. DFWS5]|uniref:Fic family protein n=1 Tax=Haloarchaeobius sp. DFWS5 TaxID=3446114 RepID=UPI003EBAEDA7